VLLGARSADSLELLSQAEFHGDTLSGVAMVTKSAEILLFVPVVGGELGVLSENQPGVLPTRWVELLCN